MIHLYPPQRHIRYSCNLSDFALWQIATAAASGRRIGPAQGWRSLKRCYFLIVLNQHWRLASRMARRSASSAGHRIFSPPPRCDRKAVIAALAATGCQYCPLGAFADHTFKSYCPSAFWVAEKRELRPGH